MYLSRLVLNPYSYSARRDLANPYQMHSSLCRAFAAPDETPPRFLWRLEGAKQRTLPHILLQSPTVPDWETFCRQDRFQHFFQVEPQSKVLPLADLTKGQTLRFRLRANPTVTKRHDDRPDKQKRVGLYKPEDLLGYTNDDGEWVPGWLERQAQNGGFDLLAFDASEVERLRFFKHKGGNPITLQSALFDGYLRITNLEGFKQTITKGVGKAKALGFGLFSIAKG